MESSIVSKCRGASGSALPGGAGSPRLFGRFPNRPYTQTVRIRKQRALQLTAAICLLILAVLPARAEVINKIVATVDGEPITLHQLKRYGERTIRGRQLTGTVDQSAILEALITDTVIEREVSEKGIVVRDEDIDHYVENIKERNKLDEEGLKNALAAQGLTLESYRAQIREEIQKAQLINREVRGKVSVSPEEVQRYYDAHISEYSTLARLQVAHILFRLPPDAPPDRVVAVTAKAEEVYGRIKKGADFAEMAKEYSEDPTGQNGGSLGWFKQGELLDNLEKAAAKLQVGEVSEPVRTPVGLHLIKLEAREGASHQNLDDLADQIRQQLYNAALEDRLQKWLSDDLRKRHHVEIQQ